MNTHVAAPRIAQFPVAIRFAAAVLRPIIRSLLRLGISANEVNDLVRWLYVDEFYNRKEFWHRRKPFGARAALLSGLSRKEVNRLSKIDQPDDAILTDQQNRAARVLAGWVNDRRFHEGGKPAPLPVETKSAMASFERLVQLYSGDLTTRTVLDELVRAGCVKMDDQGRACLVGQAYGPTSTPEDVLRSAGFGLQRMSESVDFNIAHVTGSERRLQRVWRQHLIPAEKVGDAKQLISEHAVEAGRTLDQALARMAHTKARPDQEYREVGIGMYYFEE
ncbi:MAG TPA: DUF6502 family protein [Gammaproteobacteria bacterium]